MGLTIVELGLNAMLMDASVSKTDTTMLRILKEDLRHCRYYRTLWANRLNRYCPLDKESIHYKMANLLHKRWQKRVDCIMEEISNEI